MGCASRHRHNLQGNPDEPEVPPTHEAVARPAPQAVRRNRAAHSKLVPVITHVAYQAPATRSPSRPEVATPDGLWDIAVFRHAGHVEVLQTGVITKPVELPFEPGDEYLAISFRPGAYMPRLPGHEMVDRGLLRPIGAGGAVRAGRRSIRNPDVRERRRPCRAPGPARDCRTGRRRRKRVTWRWRPNARFSEGSGGRWAEPQGACADPASAIGGPLARSGVESGPLRRGPARLR